MTNVYPVFVLGLFALLGCDRPGTDASAEIDPAAATFTDSVRVRTGAEVLAESEFELLQGRRVGLIVNHTAMVDSVHLIDVVHAAEGIDLTVLFGPEHGIRGTADAGARIEHGRDAKTNAPIFSLYGETRKPTPQMLKDVDVLVFDIQDIGARFYTYISTMGLAMQAAAENDVAFLVLDRPNPLGGDLVSGFLLEPEYTSFVGQFDIPMVHGLTVGELARMIKGEALMDGLENLRLDVVPMKGWQRDMHWPETGLPWIPPSPNIPDFHTALVYPGAVLFEATSASEGRGTREPFKKLGAPWADGRALADDLNKRSLPGVRFEAVEFTPASIEGMAASPKLEDTELQGIEYVITDAKSFRPVEAGIHVLDAFHNQAREKGITDLISRPDWLARLSGTGRLLEMLNSEESPVEIADAWREEVRAFRQRRAKYLLYGTME